jgi:hypothetical protein
MPDKIPDPISITLDSRVWQIHSVNWEEMTVVLRSTDDRTTQTVSFNAIWGSQTTLASDSGEAHPGILTDLPATFLDKASTVIRVVEEVEQALATAERRAHQQAIPFRQTETLKQILTQLDPPVGITSYYKYHGLYQKHQGDRARIATSFRRATLNQTRMKPALLHLVDQIVLRYGTRQPPRTPRILYRLLCATLERTGNRWINPENCPDGVPKQLVTLLFDVHIPMTSILNQPEHVEMLDTITPPSESWFYGYWRWFQTQPGHGRAVIDGRYGHGTWDETFMVFDTFVHHAGMPLQYVFADHWLLDVFTVDEATRQQRERLWLTLLLDAYSRSVLGFVVLAEPPSIWSIQSALAHAIWTKPDVSTYPWPCFGIPQQLFLDNAWAHHSYSLEDLARSLSQSGRFPTMDLVFRPPYKGRYGALIERYFGNLSLRVKSELAGAIQNSTPAAVRQAAQQACLLYEDVVAFIQHEILAYQHSPHRELNGRSPHAVWVDWMQMSVPQVPAATTNVQRLFWRMDSQTRVLTSKGICAFGMHYSAPFLDSTARVGRDGALLHYSFRYDPNDISCLALFRSGEWLGDIYARELRQPDGSHRPLSLAQRQLAKAALRHQRGQRDWLREVNDNLALNSRRRREQQHRQQPPSSRTTLSSVEEMTHALSNLDAEIRDAERQHLLEQFLEETDT